ncbi:MAG: 4-oxalocrotonate tautomerase family protein [Treponema sp.]|nr:4-oxalocrotonate tautomerase family protein [Treponema sp.]
MPHIVIQMYPGRDDEQKSAVAREVVEAASRALGRGIEHFSVSIEDVPQERWDTEVVPYREDGNKKLFIDKGKLIK